MNLQQLLSNTSLLLTRATAEMCSDQPGKAAGTLMVAAGQINKELIDKEPEPISGKDEKKMRQEARRVLNEFDDVIENAIVLNLYDEVTPEGGNNNRGYGYRIVVQVGFLDKHPVAEWLKEIIAEEAKCESPESS